LCIVLYSLDEIQVFVLRIHFYVDNIKMDLKKKKGKKQYELDLFGSGYGSVAACCKDGIELYGFIRGRAFTEKLLASQRELYSAELVC
jgi:hypothetical protein